MVVSVSPLTIPKQLIGIPSSDTYVTQLVLTASGHDTQGIVGIWTAALASLWQYPLGQLGDAPLNVYPLGQHLQFVGTADTE